MSSSERLRTADDIEVSGTLKIQRQESVVMENLRKLEEREALEKWERIVRYCKEVKNKQLHFYRPNPLTFLPLALQKFV